MFKKCPRCGHELPASEFYRDKRRRDGLTSYCKECSKAHSKKYQRRNDHTRYRDYVRGARNTYGVTEDDVRSMQDEQKGMCAICGKSLVNPEYKSTDLNIDHNHETGEVRGLLCVTCNFLCGQLEMEGRLDAALNYLNRKR